METYRAKKFYHSWQKAYYLLDLLFQANIIRKQTCENTSMSVYWARNRCFNAEE